MLGASFLNFVPTNVFHYIYITDVEKIKLFRFYWSQRIIVADLTINVNTYDNRFVRKGLRWDSIQKRHPSYLGCGWIIIYQNEILLKEKWMAFGKGSFSLNGRYHELIKWKCWPGFKQTWILPTLEDLFGSYLWSTMKMRSPKHHSFSHDACISLALISKAPEKADLQAMVPAFGTIATFTELSKHRYKLRPAKHVKLWRNSTTIKLEHIPYFRDTSCANCNSNSFFSQHFSIFWLSYYCSSWRKFVPIVSIFVGGFPSLTQTAVCTSNFMDLSRE